LKGREVKEGCEWEKRERESEETREKEDRRER
jgi:hypothetical protein